MARVFSLTVNGILEKILIIVHMEECTITMIHVQRMLIAVLEDLVESSRGTSARAKMEMVIQLMNRATKELET